MHQRRTGEWVIRRQNHAIRLADHVSVSFDVDPRAPLPESWRPFVAETAKAWSDMIDRQAMERIYREFV